MIDKTPQTADVERYHQMFLFGSIKQCDCFLRLCDGQVLYMRYSVNTVTVCFKRWFLIAGTTSGNNQDEYNQDYI